jgi:hypothetical protein
LQTKDVYEERIARFLELAEAAQSAAERASTTLLKVTYARLASQWVELAQMAARTIRDTRELREAVATSDSSEIDNQHIH